jgi:hypothetical protein
LEVLTWASLVLELGKCWDAIYLWQHQIYAHRTIHPRIATRLEMESFLAKIKNLDLKADSDGLNEKGWTFRYHLKGQLITSIFLLG